MADDPLVLDDERRSAIEQAVLAYAGRFLDEHRDAPPVGGPLGSDLARDLLVPPPEEGGSIDDVLATVDRAVQPGLDTASGRFLGYVPSGGVYAAALGSLLGAVTNQYTGGGHAAPGLVALEESVLRWMASLFDLPDDAGGLLLSGGSIANLTAVVAARHAAGDDAERGVVYTSARAHHSIAKAARIAGIPDERVRHVGTDGHQRLDVATLRATIAEDVTAGLRPMLLAATAGTTDTGAVDPLDGCATVAAEHGAWFHVDAAYGGFFALTERGRALFDGIERADTITVDAHKSLFLPFGTGGLLARDPARLVAAHEGAGAYMRDVDESIVPHYLARGPELTRPARGLAVWTALQLHGVAAFRDTLDRMLDLAEHAAARLSAIEGIELLDDPPLSIVVFRAADDETTAQVQQALNDSGEVYVSSTAVDDRMLLRFALLSPRTTRAHVDAAVDVVAGAVGA